MNENINLVELLKDCRKGTKFYSPICGEVEFVTIGGIFASNYPIKTTNNIDDFYFTKEGYYNMNGTPECLLFPSKDQRNWNVWKEEQDKKKSNTIKEGDYGISTYKEIYHINSIIDSHYVNAMRLDNGINYSYPINNLTKLNKYPINHFKPFDKVLVRNKNNYIWNIQFFERLSKTPEYKFCCICSSYVYCIPYNEETKHLLGTTEKAPEFYINWEEE